VARRRLAEFSHRSFVAAGLCHQRRETILSDRPMSDNRVLHPTDGGNTMMRKIIIALAAVTFAGAVAASTTADARMGGARVDCSRKKDLFPMRPLLAPRLMTVSLRFAMNRRRALRLIPVGHVAPCRPEPRRLRPSFCASDCGAGKCLWGNRKTFRHCRRLMLTLTDSGRPSMGHVLANECKPRKFE
jgi:hypothetical protein